MFRHVSVCFLLAVFGHSQGADVSLPSYTVDLASPPSMRWKAVLEGFVERNGVGAFEETYTTWQQLLQHFLPEHFESEAAHDSAALVLSALERGHPDVVAELRTLSAVLKARKASPLFELPSLATSAVAYVLAVTSPKNTTDDDPRAPSACTSTLVQNADGSVIHGRSLDYVPRDAMASTSVLVNFTRGLNRRAEYTCLHPLVYPTALQWFTCMRPGQFSLSVNARGQGQWNEHNTPFNELLRRLADPSSKLLGELAQDAMSAEDYSHALTALSSARVVSSNYFILAGAGKEEGAIVTRYGNNSAAADIWTLGSGFSSSQPSWMRVQTNVDHWVTYRSGAYSTHRRQHAIDLLGRIGAGQVDTRQVWSVYTTVSALNNASADRLHPEDTGAILRPTTIATLVFSPAHGTMSSCVWMTSAKLGGPATSQNPRPTIPLCYASSSAAHLREPVIL